MDEASSTSAADTGTTMRFTGSPDYQYIYDLATKPPTDPTATYQITITVQATGQARAGRLRVEELGRLQCREINEREASAPLSVYP